MTVIATARTRPPGTVEGGVTFVDTPTLLADRTSSPSTPPLPPQTNPELRNLHPNRTFLSHCLVQLKIATDAPRLLGFAV